MAQTHFVAVGGTGQHAALSFVDLAVLSEWLLPFDPCRLWLFDADASSATGAISAWDEACEQVSFLRRKTRTGDQLWKDPLSSHHRPYLDATDASVFRDATCPELSPLLFEEEQLSVSYRNGYYGEAAVAATVFGAVLESEAHRQKLNDLIQAPLTSDSRIVVAGSAVGGTGSGCMPRLVEKLHDAAQDDADGRIMALLYLPWFRLEGGDLHSAKRNDEMAARTASGLYYYNKSLRDNSAAVVLGHPDVNASRTPRPWQGDTQQARHDDLTLPTYGACVATQFFSADQPHPFGLYSVARPSAGQTLLSGKTPVGLHTETTATWTLERLVAANVELCRRLHWAARYIESLGNARPPTIGRGLDVAGLLSLDQGVVQHIDRWIDTKTSSLDRVVQSLSPATRADMESTALSHGPPKSGLGSLRTWVPAARYGNAEELVVAMAKQLLAEPRWTGDVPLEATSERLLPPRQADSVVQVQAQKIATGTAGQMGKEEAEGLISHNQVTARAIPSQDARAVVLRGLFEGRLRGALGLQACIEQTLRAGFKFAPDATADSLSQRWFLVLLGFAAGRVRVGDKALTLMKPSSAIQLASATMESVSGTFGASSVLIWETQEGDSHIVGYSAEGVLFVPAAATATTWQALLTDLPVHSRNELANAVAAWSQMVRRLAEATKAEPPSWLKRLCENWADGKHHLRSSFGLTDIGLRSTWGHGDSMTIRLPLASGTADASWRTFFHQFGLEVQQSCPQKDKQAKDIQALLKDRERCPKYRHLLPHGKTEDRIALWLLPPGHNDFGLHQRAARLIQDRYYISVDAACIWDVRVDEMNVKVVDPNEILLPVVGYLVEDEATRLPDWPIRWEYIDLINMNERASPPKVDGSSVEYRLQLRGYPEQTEWSAKRVDDLVLPAGVLLWPNFTAHGWRQRYIFVRHAERKALRCGIAASAEPRGTITTNLEISLPPNPAPVSFLTPENGSVPRALYLQDLDRAYGVFRLDLQPFHRNAQDNWGIDFGTSGSVVAAVKQGRDWTQARLLNPGPASDATYKVHLGEEVESSQMLWFPSWEGLAPRKTPSAVLPTRIAIWKHSAGDVDQILEQDSAHGRKWLLDHGGPLGAEVRKSFDILTELKWGKQVSKKRQAYLLRLLEQAAAWRARTPPAGSPKDSLPTQVTAVFTLPLRMRDEALSFETDVRAVVGRLRALTGIHLTPKFQWESNAGAVPENSRRKEMVYASIDLGGGSLDFWGCYTDSNGRVIQYADSLLLGGGALISALSKDGNAQRVDNILRKLSPDEPAGNSLTEVPGYSEKVSFFFDIVREVCARWLSALAMQAVENGSSVEEFNVGLLGRAWFMGGSDWRMTSKALGMIAARMAELGCDVPLTAHADVPDGQTDRKTYLARYVAGFSGNARGSISEIVDDQRGFVGMDLVAESPTVKDPPRHPRWTDTVPFRCAEDTKLYLEKRDGTQVQPPLPSSVAAVVPRYENSVQFAMNQKGGDQHGYRDSHGSQLAQSPFHNLIEMTIRGWASE